MTNASVRGGTTSLSNIAAQSQDGTTRQGHIQAIVAAWPPLTPEQLDRVSLLLRPSVDTSAVAA